MARSFWMAGTWALAIMTLAPASLSEPDVRIDGTAAVMLDICPSIAINYVTHSLPQQCLPGVFPSAPSATQPASEGATRQPPSTDTATINEPLSGSSSDGPDGPDGPDGIHGHDELQDGDTHQPLISFQDWKELMLQRSGQDPLEPRARRRRTPQVGSETDSGLDSLGDDSEIALNLDGYLAQPDSQLDQDDSPPPGAAMADAGSDDGGGGDALLYDDGRTQYYRSKDAGKTCKERFSYSSFDAGATVLKTNRGVKNAKAILVENKDSYMLLECADENKHAIVELSDDILVDTIVLANFEFFSSMIRHFRVSVSDRYPVKMDRWRDLGTFEAKNSRDIQPFLVENPQIWAKYVRIEFLTHYGNEYYCPVSLLRIHGTRMLESWQESEGSREEEDDSINPSMAQQQSPVLESGSQDAADESDSRPEFKSEFQSEPKSQQLEPEHEPESEPGSESGSRPASSDEPTGATPFDRTMSDVGVFPDPGLYWWNPGVFHTCPAPTLSLSTSCTANNHLPPFLDDRAGRNSAPGHFLGAQVGMEVNHPSSISNSESLNEIDASSAANSHPVPSFPSVDIKEGGSLSYLSGSVSRMSATKSPTTPSHPDGSATHAYTAPTGVRNNKTTATSGTSPTPPTVQESFFKSITKRLQLLESNMTLSVKYLEDQSRNLQEAFQSTERKHLARIDTFLARLNQSFLAEVKGFRLQSDHIWQSTIIALENQRDLSQREIVALSSRLNLLADEIVFQKRMAIVQSVLLLSCLILVIFSKGMFVAQPQPQPRQRPSPLSSNPEHVRKSTSHDDCQQMSRNNLGTFLPRHDAHNFADTRFRDHNHNMSTAKQQPNKALSSENSSPFMSTTDDIPNISIEGDISLANRNEEVVQAVAHQTHPYNPYSLVDQQATSSHNFRDNSHLSHRISQNRGASSRTPMPSFVEDLD